MKKNKDKNLQKDSKTKTKNIFSEINVENKESDNKEDISSDAKFNLDKEQIIKIDESFKLNKKPKIKSTTKNEDPFIEASKSNIVNSETKNEEKIYDDKTQFFNEEIDEEFSSDDLKKKKKNKKDRKAIKVGFKEKSDSDSKEKNIKDAKEKKIKQKRLKEKKDYKLAMREFPSKFITEVKRIRWAGKGSLARKFLIILAFILFFVVFYVIIDGLFTYLLGLAQIIN